jgi:hypothetical protein
MFANQNHLQCLSLNGVTIVAAVKISVSRAKACRQTKVPNITFDAYLIAARAVADTRSRGVAIQHLLPCCFLQKEKNKCRMVSPHSQHNSVRVVQQDHD